MDSTIPHNERPTWYQADEDEAQAVAQQFEPLGKAPETTKEQAAQWQTAPPATQAQSWGGHSHQKRHKKQHDWGWEDKGEGWWFWPLIIAFFVFGGPSWFSDDAGSWFGANWWWLLWLWWPITSFLTRALGIERRVLGGVALILVALTFLIPGSLTTGAWLGLGMVGLGLVSLFRKQTS